MQAELSISSSLHKLSTNRDISEGRTFRNLTRENTVSWNLWVLHISTLLGVVVPASIRTQTCPTLNKSYANKTALHFWKSFQNTVVLSKVFALLLNLYLSDAWTYWKIIFLNEITMSVSTLCLTSHLHKILHAVAFILINHPVHSHGLPGVHKKSSVFTMSGDEYIGNLSTSKLCSVNSI